MNNIVVNGYEVRLERRRYGDTAYTWAEALIGGEWKSLGDPWPCLTPKRSELAEQIAFLTRPK